MRKHDFTLGGVALSLALALTGCGGDDTEPVVQETPSQAPSPTPVSTPTPKTPEERAARQLVKYLSVRDDALRAMKFDGKRFDSVAAGQEFVTLQQRIIEYSSNGFTLRGEYEHSLRGPRQRSDSTMVVEVCEDESGIEFLTEAGNPVTRSLGGAPIPVARSVKYTLNLTKGRWLVTGSTYVLDADGLAQPC